MKKVIEKNHKFLQHVLIYFFPIGIAWTMVIGMNVIASQDVNVHLDMSAYPLWSGYLLMYGGLLLLVDYAIDMLIIPLVLWFLKRNKQPSLQERIDGIK